MTRDVTRIWAILLCAAAIWGLESRTVSAGVIRLQMQAEISPPPILVVGDTVSVSISLEGLGQARPFLWAVGVTVPDGFTTPDVIQFGPDPVLFGMGKFLSPVLEESGFSTIALPSPHYAPSSFSFMTTALRPGVAEFEVFGFALVDPNECSFSLPDIVMGLSDTLSLNVISPSSPPPISHAAPEPSSFAIFACLAGTLSLRRRRA